MKKTLVVVTLLFLTHCSSNGLIKAEYDQYKDVDHIWIKFNYSNSYIVIHKKIKNKNFVEAYASFGMNLGLHSSPPQDEAYLKINNEIIKVKLYDTGSDTINDNYAYIDPQRGFRAGSNSFIKVDGKFIIDKRIYEKLKSVNAFEIRFYLGKLGQNHWTFYFSEKEAKQIALFAQAETLKK